MVEVVTLDKNGGIERLEKALAIINEEITSRDGIFKKVQGAHRIGAYRAEADEADMKEKMLMDHSDRSEEEDNREDMNVDLGDDIEDEDN